MSGVTSVMIAGCGDVGGRLAVRLHDAGWQVYGMRRTVSELPEGALPVAGDLHQPGCPEQWPEGELDYLV